jgi:hypothetical protein
MQFYPNPIPPGSSSRPGSSLGAPLVIRAFTASASATDIVVIELQCSESMATILRLGVTRVLTWSGSGIGGSRRNLYKPRSDRTTTCVLISRAMHFPDGNKVQDSRTTYPWSGQMQLPLYNTHSTLDSPALYPSSCSALNSGLRDHGYPGPSSGANHTPRHGTPSAQPLIIYRTHTPAFRAGNRLTLCSDAEAVLRSLERSRTRGR